MFDLVLSLSTRSITRQQNMIHGLQRFDRMKIIDLVLYFYISSIMISSTIHFCNVQNKSQTTSISWIQYWQTICFKENIIFFLNFKNYEINR